MPDEPRLVPSPVFLLSPIRSGSTLLRCILGSHPQIHAPHELHLGGLEVRTDDEFTELAIRTLQLTPQDLRHLLWDRLLYRQLTASGRPIVVEKSPGNVFVHSDLLTCWPQARFLILRRHPVAIKFATALEAAAANSPGAVNVTYEELTSAPEVTCRRLCDFLGIAWEPGMLDYGRQEHGPFVYGIGDWSEQIRSGHVQPPTPLPAEKPWPTLLRDWASRWGYSA
jgi:hypothetical protein